MKETRDAGDAASDLEEIPLSERSDAHLKGKSVEKGDSSYLGVNLLRYQNAIEMCSGLRGEDEVIESDTKQSQEWKDSEKGEAKGAMNISSWTCCVQNTLETSEPDVYPQAVQDFPHPKKSERQADLAVSIVVASSVADIMEIWSARWTRPVRAQKMGKHQRRP